MKRALIRLEDVGPGGSFGTEENLLKLRVIADYLEFENVPFHVSVIPRFINPSINYDKDIADVSDPYIVTFISTIKYLQKHGGSIGMHGYTHQYGDAISGLGYEFYHSGVPLNCPPDDSMKACLDKESFENSYASSRMRQGFESFAKAGIKLDWISTPHYAASATQRCIIEAWTGILFEEDPRNNNSKMITLHDIDDQLYRGVVYVPTPLDFIKGPNLDLDIKRICKEIEGYTPDHLASFFYHAFRELSFIRISRSDGIISIDYDDNSYLKRLIRGFKEQGFTFMSLLDLLPFVPSLRQTDFFSGRNNIFLTGDVNNDGKTELIIRETITGNWYGTTFNIEAFPNRQCAGNSTRLLLSNWGKGDQLIPLIGDFNGDGFDDVVVWNPVNGNWQVALSHGTQLYPDPRTKDNSWLNKWGIGKHWIPLVGDFNGDGKEDLVIWNRQRGEWHVALSSGHRFVPSDHYRMSSWGVGRSWIGCVGDFNGDGKDDIVILDRQKGEWRMALSDGRKFTRKSLPYLQSWLQGSNWTLFAGDFDGDGKDDILAVDALRGVWKIAQSTGSEFIPLENVFSPWSAGDDMQPLVGDFNGSRKVSICARHPKLRNGTIDLAISVMGNRETN